MIEQDVDDLFFQADTLLTDNKIIEGRDLLLEILVISPDYGKAHNHLGWIYHYKTVNYDKAERHYKLSIKYSKNYSAAYSNFSYLLIDKGRYTEMLNFGKKSLKVEGVDKGVILNQMGKAYELRLDLMDAYNSYKKAKMHCAISSYIEEINSSLQRVQNKMNFFQKIKVLFK